MSIWIPIVQVNSFTSLPFAGNPATVMLDADAISEAQMQRIALEVKLSGTAFVSRTALEGADLRLRCFTPTREVAYSGHTTLAAVHTMIEAGRLPGDSVVFDTPGGLLEVRVERKVGGTIIWLLPPLPTCVPFEGQLPAVLETLGHGIETRSHGLSRLGALLQTLRSHEGILVRPRSGDLEVTPCSSSRESRVTSDRLWRASFSHMAKRSR